MKLKKLSKEELESMGYDELAYQILVEENKKMKLPDIFRKICDLLELDESEFEAKIGDFFQLISRDQRFTMLDKGFWDLKEKHKATVIIAEADDEDMEDTSVEEDLDLTEEDLDTESTYYDEDSEEDDVADDDLKDLVIISDSTDDEANMS